MSQQHAIELGDVLAVLADYKDNSFDAVFCDPPYGLSFMGKKWDYDVPSVALWKEVFRVCKPGAPLIAFSGTRTYHRTVIAIEDAGWEIRDQLAWMFGSGFPKSLDIAKAIDKTAGHWRGKAGALVSGNDSMSAGNYERTPKGDPITAAAAWAGYGTALKPAFEPAVLARKPIEGTVANNVAKWGVGGLAIDATRIDATDKTKAPVGQYTRPNVGTTGHTGIRNSSADDLGRWPANVCLDEEAAAALDAQTGNRPGMSGGGKHKSKASQTGVNGFTSPDAKAEHARGDSGGASRFFYTAKTSTKEREYGCENLALRSAAEMTDSEEGQARLESPRTGAGRGGGARNHHPTLKPISLTTYLARLIMPPNPGAILVPFAGAGSEMIGCLKAGWPCVVGIERESEYIEIARARVAAWAA